MAGSCWIMLDHSLPRSSDKKTDVTDIPWWLVDDVYPLISLGPGRWRGPVGSCRILSAHRFSTSVPNRAEFRAQTGLTAEAAGGTCPPASAHLLTENEDRLRLSKTSQKPRIAWRCLEMLPKDAQSLLCRCTISDLVTIDLIAVCIAEVSAQLIVTLGASCTVALLWPCQPLLRA